MQKLAIQFLVLPQIISALKYEGLSELKTKKRNTIRFQTRINTKKIYSLYYPRSQTEYYSPSRPKKFMTMIACKYLMRAGIRNAQENSSVTRIIIRLSAMWLNKRKHGLNTKLKPSKKQINQTESQWVKITPSPELCHP